ncbi:protein Star-like, partial [Daphnia pulicaria]|uniref:protein Star-like n=1 Tax=Daphnia pulicaria TaxID=35523 RepID=UPI001EEBB90C
NNGDICQTNGFFIECGALDGEFLSNTLYMERSLNWTGILIEADQKAFSQLAGRNRKAYSLPVCLSTKPYPVEVVFNASDWSGSFIVDDNQNQQLSVNNANTIGESIYKVQCFPLYSILVAVGRTEIDFFGLDVEGSEYKILQTIPWHKVDFKTLSVEWNHVPEGEPAMTRLMESNKFVKFGHIDMAYSREVIYVQDFLDDFRQFEFD